MTDCIKIAFADDHVMVRNGISEYINKFEGCQVTIEVNNGRELIEQLEATSELPDICILDIFMPVMNGLQTLINIREKWPDVKTLVLTGHNTDYYLNQMVRAGACGYLQKSCSPKELENAIRSIYENGIYCTDVMSYKFYKAIRNNETKLPEFTANEIALLKYCCSDLSYDQIADKMGITMHSVDWCRNSLFKKLEVKSRSSLVLYAVQFGLVSLDVDSTGKSLSLKKH